MPGSGTLTVASAPTVTISHGYCTLDNLKDWLMPDLSSADTSFDDRLNVAINAASRAIERYCGRRFYANSTDETRYVTATDAGMLLERDLGVDIISLTSLSADEDGDRTYERSWTTGDYDLEPANAALDSEPYTRIAVTPDGSYSFPVGIAKGVKLVGVFGYCTSGNQDVAASELRGACLIQAAYEYMHSVVPGGVGGGDGVGSVQLTEGLVSEVARMLWPLRRGLAY